MGTLSKSIKKLKRMEEEIFALRLHLDNLRAKLKNKNLTFKEIDLEVPLSTFDKNDPFIDSDGRCTLCGEIIPNFCPTCGKKIAGTKNIVYGMGGLVDWHCLNCYYKKWIKENTKKDSIDILMEKVKSIWVLDFIKWEKGYTNPTFLAEKYYDKIEELLKGKNNENN